METGVAPLTIISNDPLEDSVPSVLSALDSVDWKVLVPKQGTCSAGKKARIPLNYKVKLLLEYFGILCPETGKQEQAPSWQQ